LPVLNKSDLSDYVYEQIYNKQSTNRVEIFELLANSINDWFILKTKIPATLDTYDTSTSAWIPSAPIIIYVNPLLSGSGLMNAVTGNNNYQNVNTNFYNELSSEWKLTTITNGSVPHQHYFSDNSIHFVPYENISNPEPTDYWRLLISNMIDGLTFPSIGENLSIIPNVTRYTTLDFIQFT